MNSPLEWHCIWLLADCFYAPPRGLDWQSHPAEKSNFWTRHVKSHSAALPSGAAQKPSIHNHLLAQALDSALLGWHSEDTSHSRQPFSKHQESDSCSVP